MPVQSVELALHPTDPSPRSFIVDVVEFGSVIITATVDKVIMSKVHACYFLEASSSFPDRKYPLRHAY